MQRNKPRKALLALLWLRGQNYDVTTELNELKAAVGQEEEEQSENETLLQRHYVSKVHQQENHSNDQYERQKQIFRDYQRPEQVPNGYEANWSEVREQCSKGTEINQLGKQYEEINQIEICEQSSPILENSKPEQNLAKPELGETDYGYQKEYQRRGVLAQSKEGLEMYQQSKESHQQQPIGETTQHTRQSAKENKLRRTRLESESEMCQQNQLFDGSDQQRKQIGGANQQLKQPAKENQLPASRQQTEVYQQRKQCDGSDQKRKRIGGDHQQSKITAKGYQQESQLSGDGGIESNSVTQLYQEETAFYGVIQQPTQDVKKREKKKTSKAMLWLRKRKHHDLTSKQCDSATKRQQKGGFHSIISAMFKSSSVKSLAISYGLFICQQMCAINLLFFYTPDIFKVIEIYGLKFKDIIYLIQLLGV